MAKFTLGDLIAQKAALDKQIANFQREQRSDTIVKVRTMMAEYGLTLADIGAGRAGGAKAMGKPGKPAKAANAPQTRKPKGTPSKVAAKYRDQATGDTWSGRGLKPRWLTAALANGRQISEFAL